MNYQRHRSAILKLYNDCCAWCGITAGQTQPAAIHGGRSYKAKTRLSLDHCDPQSKGGGHDPKNLQCLCNRCNSIKKDRYLPKLPPRMPSTSADAYALQQRLQDRIMPARRQTVGYIPRSLLGY